MPSIPPQAFRIRGPLGLLWAVICRLEGVDHPRQGEWWRNRGHGKVLADPAALLTAASSNLGPIDALGRVISVEQQVDWVDSWVIYYDWWLKYFELSKTAYMFREPLSRIYYEVHVVTVALVHWWAHERGFEELEAAAKLWLDDFWRLAHYLRPAGVGTTVAFAGARSWCGSFVEPLAVDLVLSGHPEQMPRSPLCWLAQHGNGLWALGKLGIEPGIPMDHKPLTRFALGRYRGQTTCLVLDPGRWSWSTAPLYGVTSGRQGTFYADIDSGKRGKGEIWRKPEITLTQEDYWRYMVRGNPARIPFAVEWNVELQGQGSLVEWGGV